jgi:hypothetical protein
MNIYTLLRWVGVAAVACFIATPAMAVERGLYLVDGTSDYYFIDESGVRHVVQNYDTVRDRWFSSMPVVKTRLDVIRDLPVGEVITQSVGPDMVVKKSTTTTTVHESGPTRLSRGLYAVDGTSDYYFVDEFGTRHALSSFDTVKSRWFSNMPVVKTKLELIQSLPAGDVITETVGPDMVVKKKTTSTTVDDLGTRSTTTKTEESTTTAP